MYRGIIQREYRMSQTILPWKRQEVQLFVGWNNVWLILRPCQHDNGYIYGRSQIQVHTDERTQIHSAQSYLVVTHPSTNRGRVP